MNATQKRVWQSGIETFGDSGCPEIPSDSLHLGDGSFLVDVLWPLLVAEDGFVQEEITVYVVSETHDKTFK